ncbi:MAG: Ig-like domain-containing protein [Gammaproteobacteria bacterium]|nr:Ig-like domain-containing protein [Gammaproteobacteria bacterium]
MRSGLTIALYVLLIVLSACGEPGQGARSNRFLLNYSSPADGATNVRLDEQIVIGFNQAIDENTVNKNSFRVQDSKAKKDIAGVFTYLSENSKILFTSAAGYLPNTLYTVTVDHTVTNEKGVHLKDVVKISFTTGESDKTRQYFPDVNDIEIGLNAKIKVNFERAVLQSTLTSQSFYLEKLPEKTIVATGIEYNNTEQVATLVPSSPLIANTTYAYVISNTVTDIAGTPFSQTPISIPFKTRAASTITTLIGTSEEEALFGTALFNDVLFAVGYTEGILSNSPSGSGDAYIVAVNANTGEILARHQFGTALHDMATDIVIGGSGEIYVLGESEGSVQTGAETVNTIFLAQYTFINNTFAQSWMTELSANIIGSQALAIDVSGNVYIAGYSDASFGLSTIYGNADVLVWKYNKTGALLWDYNVGSFHDDEVEDIAVSNNYVYVSGRTYGVLGSSEETLDPIDISFISQFTKQGVLVKNYTIDELTSGFKYIVKGITNIGDDLYFTGNVVQQVDPNVTPGTQPSINDIKSNMFIARIDALTSTVVLLKTEDSYSSLGHLYGKVIRPAADKSALFVGSEWVLDQATDDVNMKSVVGKYSLSGETLWNPGNGEISASDHAEVYDVTVSPSNEVFVSGLIHGDMDGLISNGMGDGFVVKFDSQGVKQ